MVSIVRNASARVHSVPSEVAGQLPTLPTLPTETQLPTHRDLFPENVKQALVLKTRSRFAQPFERESDALRVTLVERGGKDLSSMWVELPYEPTAEPVSRKKVAQIPTPLTLVNAQQASAREQQYEEQGIAPSHGTADATVTESDV